MASRRSAALLGFVGTLVLSTIPMLAAGGATAADLRRHRVYHVRHYYPPEPPVVPLGYAYGGYQRAYPPGYGYVVPGQGYVGPGFGFPGY